MVIPRMILYVLLLSSILSGHAHKETLCNTDGDGAASRGASLLQYTRARYHNEGTTAMQRFPFKYVFFSHVPKVGGTSLRNALGGLCKSRGQKLLMCYNDMLCSDRVTDYLGKVEDALPLATNGAFHWERLGDNQMVYGHGVRAGSERIWGLDRSKDHAHILVLREPVSLLVSVWAHQNRIAWWPNYNLNLDEWIDRGKAEAFVDYFASFLIDIDVPDPWDPNQVDAFDASSGKSILLGKPDWKKSLAAAVEAKNTLLLFQDSWDESVDRLARFLGLTSEERNTMLTELQYYHAPESTSPPATQVSLTKDNLDRLMQAAQPLQFVYQKARSLSPKPVTFVTMNKSVTMKQSEVKIEQQLDSSTVTLSVVLESSD